MKRRKFIEKSVLASSALLIPGFLKSTSANLLNTSEGNRLVVIQLSGGNDGLNTIVPFRNDLYYQLRPSLALSKNKVIQLADNLGWHPALQALQKWYDKGVFSIVNNVGYPNPDRSHFRSMDIWHTASGSNETLTTGWLGRYLDNQCNGCDISHTALQIGQQLHLSLKGKNEKGFVMTNPQQLKRGNNNPFHKGLTDEFQETTPSPLSYMYKTMRSTQSSTEYLFETLKKGKAKSSYPGNAFGKSLKMIAQLLPHNEETKIYYAELNGFDTHANQLNVHERLLKVLSESLDAFLKDLERQNLLERTTIFVFSEFGRRVKQNASNGTDHGAANNVWILGGNLKSPGFYNQGPNLVDLDNGDLIYEIDFRSVYGELLESVLGVDSTVVLNKKFSPLGIV